MTATIAKEWQTCPVCAGHGIVSEFFYVYPAGQDFVSIGAGGSKRCRTCSGRGVIARPA